LFGDERNLFAPTLVPTGRESQSVLRKPTVKSFSQHICTMTTDLRTIQWPKPLPWLTIKKIKSYLFSVKFEVWLSDTNTFSLFSFPMIALRESLWD